MTDHSLPYLVNCSLMFTEEPLLRRRLRGPGRGVLGGGVLVAVCHAGATRPRRGYVRRGGPGGGRGAGGSELLRG